MALLSAVITGAISMAIIIPSSKFYNIKNPKVIDNVIERIEVEGKELSQNEDFGVPVYGESFSSPDYLLFEPYFKGGTAEGIRTPTDATEPNVIYHIVVAAYAEITDGYSTYNIKFPANLADKRIESFLDKDSIQATVYCTKNTYRVTGNYDISNELYTEKTRTIQSTITRVFNLTELTEINSSYTDNSGQESITASAGVSIKSKDNLSTIKPVFKDGYIEFNDLKILSFLKTTSVYGSAEDENYYNIKTVEVWGEHEEYIPQKIELTFYGNTIGVNLSDKTVYINGQTAKKVHKISGNELMQTSNYYQTKEINAIENAFAKTLDEYANGKETATISCTIDNYYFYDETKQNGKGDLAVTINQNKVQLDNNFATINITQPSGLYEMQVSIETPLKHDLYVEVIYGNQVEINKTFVIKAGKTYSSILKVGNMSPTKREIVSTYYKIPMLFKMYDKVIPMVYGADGVDRPMSFYQDGSPKVFQVLGSNIFYDGEPLQELSLQEVKKRSAI